MRRSPADSVSFSPKSHAVGFHATTKLAVVSSCASLRSVARSGSGRLLPRPQPIHKSENRRNRDYEKLAPVHPGHKDAGEEQRDRGDEDAAGQAERIRVRLFLAQRGKRRGHRTINEKTRDAGQESVPFEIPGDRKEQKDGGKNHDGEMRSSKARMNLAEEGGKVSSRAHRIGDSRRVQHVGA